MQVALPVLGQFALVLDVSSSMNDPGERTRRIDRMKQAVER